MIKQAYTLEQQARILNVTVEQCRQQHRRNAESSRVLAEKAEKAGRKINGYTAEQWKASARLHSEIASGEASALHGGKP
jgi:hypothetical protein